MRAREKQCTPFTGLFPCSPCFPLCFGTGQIGESERERERERDQSVDENFPCLWRQCVLRVSLEVALPKQSTSQIHQSIPGKWWSRWRQVTFRGVSFFRPKSCPHLMVFVCLCQTACVWRSKKTCLAAPAPCPQCHELTAIPPVRHGARARNACSRRGRQVAIVYLERNCA